MYKNYKENTSIKQATSMNVDTVLPCKFVDKLGYILLVFFATMSYVLVWISILYSW